MGTPGRTAAQTWQQDSEGNYIPPELQSEFLDWLLADDKSPPTEDDWCKLHGLSRETTKKWKRDRRFKEVWEKRATEHVVSPARLKSLLDRLFNSADAMGDVGAARAYLSWAEKLLPPKQVQRDASVAHLSDDELVAEIRTLIGCSCGE